MLGGSFSDYCSTQQKDCNRCLFNLSLQNACWKWKWPNAGTGFLEKVVSAPRLAAVRRHLNRALGDVLYLLLSPEVLGWLQKRIKMGNQKKNPKNKQTKKNLKGQRGKQRGSRGTRRSRGWQVRCWPFTHQQSHFGVSQGIWVAGELSVHTHVVGACWRSPWRRSPPTDAEQCLSSGLGAFGAVSSFASSTRHPVWFAWRFCCTQSGDLHPNPDTMESQLAAEELSLT